jgi:UDP-glucose:glycoprotein glucosyltransferase
VLDLALVPSLDTIVNSMSTMIQRGVPIRFGIVPMYSSEDDEICAFSQLHIKNTMVETFSVQDGPDIPLRSQDLRPRRYA